MAFNWNDTPVGKVAEDIRDNGEKNLLVQNTQRDEAPVVATEQKDDTKKESVVEPMKDLSSEAGETTQEKSAEPTEKTKTEPTENTKQESEGVAGDEETVAVEKTAVTAKGRKRKNSLTGESFTTKGKKTENGIVVNVPMEDYMQLMIMKCQTGRTLKDLALQAIHEFVVRNK